MNLNITLLKPNSKIFSDNSDLPTSELTNLNIKPEPTFHTQNHPVDHSSIYNLDNGEDFDYQNQKFPTESPCDRLLQQYFLPQKQRNQVIQKNKTKYYTKLLDTYNRHPHNQNQITQIVELLSKNLHKDHNLNKVKIP